MSYRRGEVEPRPRAYESQDDRNQASEAHYTCDRLGERSILAMVSVYRETLAGEFWAWHQLHHFDRERPVDALQRWEHERFGAALFPAAHGILRFTVREQTAPADRWQPRRPPEMSAADRLKAFDAALGKMARERAMGPVGREPGEDAEVEP